MKKLITAAAAAALLVPAISTAGGPPKARVNGYATLSEVDTGGPSSADGLGFGVNGWGMLTQQFYLHGEYQTTSVEVGNTNPAVEYDLQSLRLGGGMVGSLGGGTMWIGKAEYLDFGSDLDQSGFGVHGGIILGAGPALQLSGTVGYLTTDDTDGIELNVGGHFAINQQFGLFADYRTYLGSVDPTGDIDINDLRFGAAYTFF